MSAAGLSRNDSCVLSALFDPESSLSSTVQVDRDTIPTQVSEDVRSKERLALQAINKIQPSFSEIEQATSTLTSIIEREPRYASAWTNRAQARRMLLRDDELAQHQTLVEEIFADLDRAILLATPAVASSNVSNDQRNVLASAHAHKGYLLLLASKSESHRKMVANVSGIGHLSLQDLEEAASRELGLGGRYGNETARQLAVKTNPYAKLCGSIVREALTKEIADFYQPQTQLAG